MEDIARDKRFANNPLLKGRGIRFYARRAAAGEQIPDRLYLPARHQTTAFSEENRRLLHVMADEVTEELERRLPPKIEAPTA